MVMQCSRFATDPKIIEEMTKKNKVVVFMKVRLDSATSQLISNVYLGIFNRYLGKS